MLVLQVAPILKERGIEKPYNFLVKNGFSHHTAINLVKGEGRYFRLDHIERLCRILVCHPSDLLLWTPSSTHALAATHPLRSLEKKDIPVNWKEKLAGMPLDELKEITRSIMSKSADTAK